MAQYSTAGAPGEALGEIFRTGKKGPAKPRQPFWDQYRITLVSPVLFICIEYQPFSRFLAGNQRPRLETALPQLLHGPLGVCLPAEPQGVAVLPKAGEVHFEVGLPGVVHHPGVHRAAVVLLPVVAQADGMVGHLPKVEQGHIVRGDKGAALGAHVRQAVVGHGVLHAGAGQLVL